MKNGDIPASMVQDPGAEGGSGRDPERTPMQWTDKSNAGFTKAKSAWLPVTDNYKTHNVKSELKDTKSFLTLYRALGKLRNKSKALRYGSFHIIDTGNDAVLGYTRAYNGQKHTILINFTDKVASLKFDDGDALGKHAISSNPHSKLKSANEVHLLAHEAVVFTK